MSYKPPYTITPKMIHLIAEIMKMIGQLSNQDHLNHQPKLRRKNMISSIYSSLAIEQNGLTLKQVTDIVNGKLVIGEMRDIVEAKNAIRVYDELFKINPLDIKHLLKYHGIMMESLMDDAGEFRKGEEGVFEGERAIFMAPPAERVPSLMKDLFDYLVHNDEHILIKSCVFHYEFEFIHPFSDGNGRMGRLFQTCLLASQEKIFAYLPVESIIKERQQAYYQAISSSHQKGNSNEFIEFMLDAILETIKQTSKSSEQEINHISIQMKKLMMLMEDGIPYTTQEIVSELRLKSRVSVKKNYIDHAIESGLIEMTIPDKPNSRNQRYIKK